MSRDKFTNLQGMERSSDWTVGERYPLSGMGPTFDGRDKPDVLAPGAHIISAINNYAASYNVNREDLAYTEVDALIPGRTNYWGAMCGTSMATPVVTGIMALWLQANPRLDFDHVRKLIGSPGSHIDAKPVWSRCWQEWSYRNAKTPCPIFTIPSHAVLLLSVKESFV